MIAVALQVLALLLGLFADMYGFALFVVGLMPGPSAAPGKQYAYASVMLTAAFYLLRYAL